MTTYRQCETCRKFGVVDGVCEKCGCEGDDNDYDNFFDDEDMDPEVAAIAAHCARYPAIGGVLGGAVGRGLGLGSASEDPDERAARTARAVEVLGCRMREVE